MKYIKRFSKVSDYEAFKGGEYITPNISLIDDGKRVYSEKKIFKGEFNVNLYVNSPSMGETLYSTVTFIIDGEKTWEEANGIMDTTGEICTIKITTLPNNKKAISISTKKTSAFNLDAYFYPKNSISSTDKIIIGYTYDFITE